MAREWTPGDVAKIVHSDGTYDYGVRCDPSGWDVAGGHIKDNHTSLTIKPLVVIDPEDREQVKALHEAFNRTGWSMGHVFTDRLQAALRSLVTPPKPPEPTGLGAVVEDAEGRVWVHTVRGLNPWTDSVEGTWRAYDAIAAIKVLSEGVVQ